MLAPFLRETLGDRGAIVGVARGRGSGTTIQCDLRDPLAVRSLLDIYDPDLIVHLAALTNVDECEQAPVEAYESNVRATQNLIDDLVHRSSKTHFIYVSTDQVYDAPGPSSEDGVRPGNIYALTKLWGEDHARRLSNSLVLRVNFYCGPEAGLVGWLSSRCRSGEPARLFTDVLFNPLHTLQLAQCIGELIDHGVTGTLNLGASGPGLSKAEFLRAAATRLELDQSLLEDGKVADLNLAAYRPRDMRMAVARAEAALGHRLPSIKQGLSILTSDTSLIKD